MRKSAILLLMFSGTLSVSAQYYMNVFQKDGKKIQYLISDLDSISITEKPAPSGNYEYVDLGLSVNWATFNVGATKPEEYGDYFAWGETEPYYEAGYAREDPQSHWKKGKAEGYGWSSYKWCNGSYSSLTKYGIVSEWGVVDNKITLDKEDDVVHIKWGDSWRMPTLSEWNELFDNCTFDWFEEGNTEFGGVAGLKITSNKFGYTDRFIFLPAAGFRYDMSLVGVGNGGLYWSSSLDTEGTDCAWDRYINSYGFGSTHSYDHRCNGLTVRPVCPSEEWLSCVSISFSKDNKTLSVGSNESLKVDVKHNDEVWDNPLIIWSSDNTSVAVVDQNGWITAKSVGTAHITASIESLSAQCTITVIEQQVFEPEYVDLGLSVNWATFNVGATKPEEYGDYYAWGETETKSTYYESTYKWWIKDPDITITKYNFISGCGTVDNKTILEPEDDVAHIKWGGSWRMPTKEELDELLNNCIWTWGTVNGVNGFFITSNKSGYTDRSIFLPAAGKRDGMYLDMVDIQGNYWINSLSSGGPHIALNLGFGSAGGSVWYMSRNYGLSVRPVCPSEEWISSVSISIVDDKKTLLVDGSAMLNYTVKHNGDVHKNAPIVWSSDNPSVAVVDENGVVTAISVGIAHITATIRSLSDQCTVTVIDNESEIEHEYVDLGLSVKWATFNVGAFNPEDFGTYYAWGETESKGSYTWLTYKWGDYHSKTKYNNNSSWGTVDNKTVLELEDDVAHVKWGDSWRMPTKAELYELIGNCTWKWTTLNGVNGYFITSNKSGYTDRTIFLPASGGRDNMDLYEANYVGSYWSSSLFDSNSPNDSYYLYFDSIYVDWSSNGRYNGFSVRPVCPSEEWFASVSINMVEDKKTLLVDGSAMLNLIVKHNGEVHNSLPIIWSSDNPSVAVVDENGVVTAISAGITHITASIRSLSAKCTITVIDDESEIVHEYVDLGLSVKWATFNVGATNPEDFGAYYAWGETEPKSTYTWENYKFRTRGYTGSDVKISKYNNNSIFGPVDNDTIIDADDDVAHVKWGGSWRMPTKAEQDELRNNCTWTLTTINGVKGYLVTSNVSDYTDRSIFLPASGFRYGTYLNYVGSDGYYWSSSLGPEDYASGACVIYLHPDYLGVNDRSFGYSVRPVCPK